MTDDQYNKLSEMYAKKINECADKDDRIASLESQLMEKDQIIESDKATHEREVFTLKSSNDLKDKEIDRLKDLFEKRGSAMQDLSEQVALLSTKSEELRESLTEALTYIDFNDIDGSVDFSKRCRKLIGE